MAFQSDYKLPTSGDDLSESESKRRVLALQDRLTELAAGIDGRCKQLSTLARSQDLLDSFSSATLLGKHGVAPVLDLAAVQATLALNAQRSTADLATKRVLKREVEELTQQQSAAEAELRQLTGGCTI